jgi:hypothetical protein
MENSLLESRCLEKRNPVFVTAAILRAKMPLQALKMVILGRCS